MARDNLLFLSLLVVFFIPLQVSATKKTCACGLLAEGVNACGCEQLVVRPPKLPKIPFAEPRVVCKKIPGVPKLGPIGDACSCESIHVSPAVGPKPPCSLSGTHHKEQHHAMVEDSSILSLESHAQQYGTALHGTFYSEKHQQYQKPPFNQQNGEYSTAMREENDSGFYQKAPADAVSLSLAYGLARNTGNVREDGLLYGPKTIPKDGFARKATSNVPEERLLSIDKQVVELRARPSGDLMCDHKTLEREVEEANAEAQEKELLEMQYHSHAFGSRSQHLNYHDLGYVPVHETDELTQINSGSSVMHAENVFNERHSSDYRHEEGNVALSDDDQCTQPHSEVQHAEIFAEDSGDSATEETDCTREYSHLTANNDAEYYGNRKILIHKLGYSFQ